MSRIWQHRPATTKLGVVLVAASLVVAMMATAQAQPTHHDSQAAQTKSNAAAPIQIAGDCTYVARAGRNVNAWVSVISSQRGTAYVNIYQRGVGLVARATRSGTSFILDAYEPYRSGRSWFATWGFNSSGGSASGGTNCTRAG